MGIALHMDNQKKFGSGEFLLSGYENKKSTGKLNEGIMPVPPYRPCAHQ